MAEKEVKKVVVNAADLILQKFGRSITVAGDRFNKKIESISTGSILLNNAIGECKGYPLGSVIEAFGWEGAGKTLLLYLAIAQAQKQYPDFPCVIIDAERQFEFQVKWATKVGVDVSKLIVLKCSTAEECFDMIHALILGEHEIDKKTGEVTKVINPGKYAIIGVDSVTQLTSSVDSIKDLGDSRQRGTQASAIGLGLKKVTSAMSREDVDSKTILFFINQLRKNPNSLGRVSDYRTGGNALPFYDTIALKVAKVWDSVERDENGDILSHDVKVTFEKNKAGSTPEDAIVFTLMHDGSGVNNEREFFDVAMLNGCLKEIQSVNKKDQKITYRYNFVDPKTGEKVGHFDDFSKRKFNEILDQLPMMKKVITDLIENKKIFTNKDEVKEETPDSVNDFENKKPEVEPVENADNSEDSNDDEHEEKESRKSKREKRKKLKNL